MSDEKNPDMSEKDFSKVLCKIISNSGPSGRGLQGMSFGNALVGRGILGPPPSPGGCVVV